MSERVDKAESVRNFYRRQGAVQERERIIKLFRDEMCKLCEHADDTTYCVDSSNFCEMNFINIEAILEGVTNE